MVASFRALLGAQAAAAAWPWVVHGCTLGTLYFWLVHCNAASKTLMGRRPMGIFEAALQCASQKYNVPSVHTCTTRGQASSTGRAFLASGPPRAPLWGVVGQESGQQAPPRPHKANCVKGAGMLGLWKWFFNHPDPKCPPNHGLVVLALLLIATLVAADSYNPGYHLLFTVRNLIYLSTH